MAAGLYLVATPIGNARDITLRALDVLAAVDVVACEDTRVTRRLLTMHGLARPLVSYREQNAAAAGARLLERMREGAAVALVSDAGMPLVSDPGLQLVAAAQQAGVPVTVVPGASAALAGLALAGLPTERFLFAGFLPSRRTDRRRAIADLAAVPATLVLFEAPHRVAAALADLAELLGPRPAALARELTKLHEEVRRRPLDELAAEVAAAERVRGEIVLVIGPPLPPEAVPAADVEAGLDALLRAALARLSLKQAVAETAEATGLPRRQVYQRALALKPDG